MSVELIPFPTTTRIITSKDGYVNINVSEVEAMVCRLWKLPPIGHLKLCIKLDKRSGKYILYCHGERKILFLTFHDSMPYIEVSEEEAKAILNTMLNIERVKDFQKFAEMFNELSKEREKKRIAKKG